MSKWIGMTFKGTASQYQITGHIKKGGMARVYDARNLSTNKNVVLKISSENFLDNNEEEIKKRLLKEAKVSLLLTHPNICRLHDVCVCERGLVRGLVIERVNGYDLEELIESRKQGAEPLPMLLICRIILQIASALEYSHNLGRYQKSSKYKKILHRDIKPSNIIVSADSEVKLIDFGISTIESADPDETRTIMGFSKYYTSPELWSDEELYQANLYREEHDIYALGLVFYELVTLKRAFKTPYDLRSGRIDSLYSHCADQKIIDLFESWTNQNINKRIKKAKDLVNFFTDYLRGECTNELDEMLKGEIKALKHYKQSTIIEKTIVETLNEKPILSALSMFELIRLYYLLHICLRVSSYDGDAFNHLLTTVGTALKKGGLNRTLFGLDPEEMVEVLYELTRKQYAQSSLLSSPFEFKRLIASGDRLGELAEENLSEEERLSLCSDVLKYLNRVHLSSNEKNLISKMTLNGLGLEPDSLSRHISEKFADKHFLLGMVLLCLRDKKGRYSRQTQIYIEEMRERISIIENVCKRYLALLNRLGQRTLRQNISFTLFEKQAIVHFMRKLSRIDGKVDEKEEEVISHLTDILSNEDESSLSIDENMSGAEIFKAVRPHNYLYLYSKLLYVAAADKELHIKEKDYLAYISGLISGNKANDFEHDDINALFCALESNFKFIKENSEFFKAEFVKLGLSDHDSLMKHFTEVSLVKKIFTKKRKSVEKKVHELATIIFGIEEKTVKALSDKHKNVVLCEIFLFVRAETARTNNFTANSIMKDFYNRILEEGLFIGIGKDTLKAVFIELTRYYKHYDRFAGREASSWLPWQEAHLQEVVDFFEVNQDTLLETERWIFLLRGKRVYLPRQSKRRAG